MIPRLTPQQLENFYSHLHVDNATECWEWQGSRLKKGHGQVRLYQKTWLVHRVMFALHHHDPGDLLVRHTCDNPPCCNPKHLVLGTYQDNVNDSIERGRHAKGARMGSAKFTDNDVRQIRKLLALNVPQSVIAKTYQVNQSSISDIKTGKTWSHLSDQESEN